MGQRHDSGLAGQPRVADRRPGRDAWFPGRPGLRRAERLFAGGPGGTAILSQDVPLRSPRGTLPARGTTYRLSGWLGGTRTSRASLTAIFVSAFGRVLGRRSIGPVGGAARLTRRSTAGVVPVGSAEARIVLRLETSLRNWDGPNAPLVGYDRALAGRLSFSVSGDVRVAGRLRPRQPRSRILTTCSCSCSRTRTTAR